MTANRKPLSALVLGALFLTLSAGAQAADHFVSVDGTTGGNNYNNDAAAPGSKSIAIGENARINGGGLNAVVVGYDAEATNNSTTALGAGAKANGWRSVAVGNEAKALETGSTAIGDHAKASGGTSTAVGVSTFATGTSATAIGHSNDATGDYSFAAGYRSTSSGNSATALGFKAKASGASSIAFGVDVESSGNSSMAAGYEAKSIGASSAALGYKAESAGNSALASGYEANASGDYSSALGYKAAASDEHASAFGSQANASAARASAFGYSAVANIAGGVALGANSKTSVDAGAAGYDPLGRSQTSPAWQSTAAGISVGDAANNITRQINNVAAGTADSDAANVAQLKALEDKLSAGQNASFGQLDGRIRDVGKRADAAAASAIAQSSIPQATRAGASGIGIGTGVYGGQSAIAVGFSTVSQSESWVFKGNVSANSKGRFGAGAGALYQW